MPPLPKDPALRQRTNKSTTRTTLEADSGRARRVPKMFEHPEGLKWNKMTLQWWRDIWKSPMSSEYLKADQHSMYRLAVLIDRFWTKPSKDLAAEIAHEQQAFGLTPLDRRRLEWSIVQSEEAKKRQGQHRPPERPPVQTGDDPRSFLSAVK